MVKRICLFLLLLAAGSVPATGGETAAEPQFRGYNEMGPATRVAPLRRRTSVDQVEPERGGGRAQVRLTIPSAGNRGASRIKIVESVEDDADGSLIFDLANGVTPDIPEIPGIFTLDMLVADPSTPTMDMAFAADSLDGREGGGRVEVLAPMTLPENRSRLAARPVQVELPPPIGSDEENAILSAMAAPAMDKGDTDGRQRMPHSAVRLGRTRDLAPPTPGQEAAASPAAPQPSRPSGVIAPIPPAPSGGSSLRPPPEYQGGVMGYPQPDAPLGEFRGSAPGFSPAIPPRRSREESLPAEVDGFIPMRQVKNIMSLDSMWD